MIIWNESSMIPKKALEIGDKPFKDMSCNNNPFGNKLIIFGGDFCHIFPNCEKWNRMENL